MFPTLFFPFLLQTSKKHEIWWKNRKSADVADGPNCSSLAGLGVEKKYGERATPHSRCISFLEYGMKKSFICVFFDEESFVHASFSLLQLSVYFCSRFHLEKSDFGCKSSKNIVFGIFECFFWYELERSRF